MPSDASVEISPKSRRGLLEDNFLAVYYPPCFRKKLPRKSIRGCVMLGVHSISYDVSARQND